MKNPRDIKNSTWKYSNIGYMILGGLLEAMFDESWETLIQKHFKKNLDVDLQFRKNLFEHKSYYNPTWAAVSKDALLAKSYLEAYLQLDFSSNTALKVAWGDLPRIYGPAGLVRMTHANAQKYYTWHLQRMRNNPSIYKDQAAVISNGDLYSKGWGITRVDGKEEFFAHSGSNLANLSNICIVPSKRTLMLQNYNSFCTKVCEDNVNRFTDRIRSIV